MVVSRKAATSFKGLWELIISTYSHSYQSTGIVAEGEAGYCFVIHLCTHCTICLVSDYTESRIHLPVLKRTWTSLVVNSEDDSRAEKWVILVRVARVVIICIVPQALRCNAYTLSSHLTNDTLNDNLVTGNMALIFDLCSDGVDDLFCPVLGVSVFVLLVSKHTLNNRLYYFLDFGGVESIKCECVSG